MGDDNNRLDKLEAVESPFYEELRDRPHTFLENLDFISKRLEKALASINDENPTIADFKIYMKILMDSIDCFEGNPAIKKSLIQFILFLEDARYFTQEQQEKVDKVIVLVKALLEQRILICEPIFREDTYIDGRISMFDHMIQKSLQEHDEYLKREITDPFLQEDIEALIQKDAIQVEKLYKLMLASKESKPRLANHIQVILTRWIEALGSKILGYYETFKGKLLYLDVNISPFYNRFIDIYKELNPGKF